MKGAITPKEFRSAGNLLIFNVNELSYSGEKVRILTRSQALDGSVTFNDWGVPEGNRVISLSNVYMSQDDYDLLVGMLVDEDHEFHYHYNNSTFRVLIERAEGSKEGKYRNTSMTLNVVEKLAEGEAS